MCPERIKTGAIPRVLLQTHRLLELLLLEGTLGSHFSIQDTLRITRELLKRAKDASGPELCLSPGAVSRLLQKHFQNLFKMAQEVTSSATKGCSQPHELTVPENVWVV